MNIGKKFASPIKKGTLRAQRAELREKARENQQNLCSVPDRPAAALPGPSSVLSSTSAALPGPSSALPGPSAALPGPSAALSGPSAAHQQPISSPPWSFVWNSISSSFASFYNRRNSA